MWVTRTGEKEGIRVLKYVSALGTGGVAQSLRALAEILEVLGSVPGNHVVVHNHL